jgi:tryptophan synthase beta chain
MQPTKILLDESEIPTHWYNVVADMPVPPAPPRGGDGQPLGPDAMGAIFPDALIEQEMSGERWIPIPEPVREIYRLWRPSPLYRAHRLEAELGTPARIYYKYEGVSPAGSHKPNTAVAQAYYNQQAGIRRLATETGAGQWGGGPVVRPRDPRLHGEGELPPEAVPALHDADLGRRGAGEPV